MKRESRAWTDPGRAPRQAWTDWAALDLPEAEKQASATARFTAEAGNRLLTLRYSRFNHGPGGVFAPQDGRHLAAAFTRLSLRPAQPSPSRLVFVEK